MIYIQLPASLSFRYMAVRTVNTVCRALGQSVAFADAVASAVGEAFNNAVLHAQAPQNDARPIEIEVGTPPGAIEIRVCDYGHGFALESVPEPDLEPESVADFPESGMGLFIIRSLMSHVAYQEGQPNVFYMRKDLQA